MNIESYSRVNKDSETYLCDNCKEDFDENSLCDHTSHTRCHDCCNELTGGFYDDYRSDLD